jgi:hypothetical protein
LEHCALGRGDPLTGRDRCPIPVEVAMGSPNSDDLGRATDGRMFIVFERLVAPTLREELRERTWSARKRPPD